MSRLTSLLVVAFVVLVGSAPVLAGLVEVQLRAASSPSATDAVGTLPASITDVGVGSSFYLEVWVKDVGSPLWGVTTGYLDIAYDTAKVDATGLGHGGLYVNFASGSSNDAAGLVNEFGGGWLPASAGDPPPGKTEWARLGWISFTRTATGPVLFTPQQADDEFSRSSGGAVAWSQIYAPPMVLPEPSTLVLVTLGSFVIARRRARRAGIVE